jgi:Ca-activated chloride channel family protein
MDLHYALAFLGVTWRWPFFLSLAPVYLLLMALAAFLHRRRLYRLARLGYHLPRGLGFRLSIRRWLGPNSRWYTALLLLTIGVAGPFWGKNKVADVAPDRDLVLVVDLSRSMLATDVLPSRFGRAGEAIEKLCEHLQKRGGVRLALVGFASQGRVLCPLTHDYDHVRQLAAGLDPASPPAGVRPEQPGSKSGTRIGEGLRAAQAAIDPNGQGFVDIVLLSDGDDPAEDGEYREGVKVMQSLQAPVHVVGIGNPQASWDLELPVRRGGKQLTEHVATSLKEAPLREIARTTGGVYVPARTQTCDLAGLYDEIIEPLPRVQKLDSTLTQPPSRQGWFFAAALLLFLFEFIRPKAWIKSFWFKRTSQPRPQQLASATTIFLLATVSLAAAFPEDIESLLRAGYRAFAGGRYQEAQAVFEEAKRLTGDPGFAALDQAVSLIRLGQYDDALVCVRQCLEDADQERRSAALFVRGICLFRQAGSDAELLGRAAADFREVLNSASAGSDLALSARHNLELTRILLAQVSSASNQDQRPGSESGHPGGDKERDDGAEGHGDRRRVAADASKRGSGYGQDEEDANLPGKPGRGNLPLTLGDSGNVLSSAAALELLAEAEKRIQADLLEQRRQRVLDANAPTKDW